MLPPRCWRAAGPARAAGRTPLLRAGRSTAGCASWPCRPYLHRRQPTCDEFCVGTLTASIPCLSTAAAGACIPLRWNPDGLQLMERAATQLPTCVNRVSWQPCYSPNTWLWPSSDRMISPPGSAAMAGAVSLPIPGSCVCSPVSASNNTYLQPNGDSLNAVQSRQVTSPCTWAQAKQDAGDIVPCKTAAHCVLKAAQTVLPPSHCMATGLCASATSLSSTKSAPS